MRILIIAILTMFTLSVSIYGQRRSTKDIASIEVTQPEAKRTQGCDHALQITKITIDAEYTRIDFVYRPDNPYGVNIPRQPHLYLQIKADDGNIYKALQTGGMKNYGNNVKPDKPEWFSVIFEKMPFDIIAFDLVEGKPIEGVYKLPKWNFYDVRIKTETQIRAEINQLKKEAEKGDADAAFELGRKYEIGKEVAQNMDQAYQYYLKSAENGNIEAKEKVAFAYFTSDSRTITTLELATTYLMDAAKNGSGSAQAYLGKLYEIGSSLEKNLEESAKWYEASAYSGNSYGQFWLAQKKETSGDYASAAQWYEKAIAQEDYIAPYAQNSLGDLYYFGRGVEQSYETAFLWFQKSANNRHPNGKSNLAHMYEHGYGISKNNETAINLYEEIIATVDSDDLKSSSLNSLGNIYSRENNFYNLEKAVSYYQKAIALDNNIYSLYSIGKMYNDGKGVLKNPAKAKEYLEKSAQSGYNAAEYELGLLYKTNNDLQSAFKWFEKSAQNDYAAAQYELGLMYFYGKGVAKNNGTAAKWIENAYNAGNEDAKKVWNGLELWKYK